LATPSCVLGVSFLSLNCNYYSRIRIKCQVLGMLILSKIKVPGYLFKMKLT